MLELIPSVVIRKGKVVSGPERLITNKKPLDYLRPLFEKFGKVLIYDLDGIMKNKPQWSILKKLELKEYWVDAGVRTTDGIFELLLSGANRVLISTPTLWGIKELEGAFKLSENIMFRIVLEDTDVVYGVRGTELPLRELVYRLRTIGIKELMFSGMVDSLSLSAKTVEFVLGIARPEEFDIYMALPANHEKSRLEDMGIKGIVSDVEELV